MWMALASSSNMGGDSCALPIPNRSWCFARRDAPRPNATRSWPSSSARWPIAACYEPTPPPGVQTASRSSPSRCVLCPAHVGGRARLARVPPLPARIGRNVLGGANRGDRGLHRGNRSRLPRRGGTHTPHAGSLWSTRTILCLFHLWNALLLQCRDGTRGPTGGGAGARAAAGGGPGSHAGPPGRKRGAPAHPGSGASLRGLGHRPRSQRHISCRSYSERSKEWLCRVQDCMRSPRRDPGGHRAPVAILGGRGSVRESRSAPRETSPRLTASPSKDYLLSPRLRACALPPSGYTRHPSKEPSC